jgi:pyruvate dehydrogenase E2 component (dihydrolipoamide acetyltransferase)
VTDIRVPDIGDVDEVEVIEICVKSGDEVGENDPVVVIESDKASMEVPAGSAGVIEAVLVKIGDRVKQGSLLARLRGAAKGAEPQAVEPVAIAPAEKPVAPPAVANDATASEMQVYLPDIGDAKDVIVIELAVAIGATVAKGDLLLVVESDKASMEIPAPESGVIKALHVVLEQPVNKGSLLATLEVSGQAATAPTTPVSGAASKASAATSSTATRDHSLTTGPVVEVSTAESASSGSEVYAGPAVRLLAREFGVDLTRVTGTGNRGRILKEDVQDYVKAQLKATSDGARSDKAGPEKASAAGAGIPVVPLPDFSKFGPIELEPLTRIRRVGAQNLHRSWLNVPHVTQHDEADITSLEEFRKSIKADADKAGVKVTPLSFLVKAVCAALKAHPRLNSSLDAACENFILKRYFHIGFAVDAPDGLVVPVIRDADRLGIYELSKVIAELADKARRGKLAMADMQGGTFSVSSLGALGGTGFTPIVNAPEVAILGVGRLVTKPVWNGQEFRPREMLPLSLSYDHRAINGAEAGRFVVDLCGLLADVRRWIL